MSIVVEGSFETTYAQARLILRCKNENEMSWLKFVNVLIESVLSQEPLAFPTSIFVIFMLYFFSLHTISSFLKSSLLYCYHFMFEMLNAMYVVQCIYVLGDELNKLLLSF